MTTAEKREWFGFRTVTYRGPWHGFREGREYEPSLCGRALFGVARRHSAGRCCKICERIWAKRYPKQAAR